MILEILRTILLITSILFAWIACLPFRRHSKYYQWLIIFLAAALLLETWGLISNLKLWSNSLFYNLFSIFDFLVFTYLVHLMVKFKRWTWILILITGLGGYAFATFGAINSQDLLIEGFLVAHILNCFVALYSLYIHATNSREQLFRIPAFWFLLGSLIYYGGSIPMLGASNLLYELDRSLAFAFFWIVPVSAIIRYLFIGYGCILEQRRVSS